MSEDDLGLDELGWLLGLAGAKRRKLAKPIGPRPGQAAAQYADALEKRNRALAWAISVEDHLIQILAAEGIDGYMHLQEHHVRRLREIERAA